MSSAGQSEKLDGRGAVFCQFGRWEEDAFVPEEKLPSDGLSDVTESLTEGIESCRSVIANYKSLLSSEPSESTLPQRDGNPPQSNELSFKAERSRS